LLLCYIALDVEEVHRPDERLAIERVGDGTPHANVIEKSPYFSITSGAMIHMQRGFASTSTSQTWLHAYSSLWRRLKAIFSPPSGEGQCEGVKLGDASTDQ
jgi:hypothetical protein